MQLSVTGRQIEVGDALRQHVTDALTEVVGKYFEDSLDAHVTFSKEAHLFSVDIIIHVGRGMTLQSSGSAVEPYPAFDQAAERMSERLRRQKNRIRDHHKMARHAQEDVVLAQSFVLTSESSYANEHTYDEKADVADNPVIVAETTTDIATLTVSEAVMRLDLGDLPALMFHNRAHGGLNMIYRRADGNIGWIDPPTAKPAASHKSSAAH